MSLLDHFDADRIADGINRAWDAYSVTLMIALPVIAAGVLWLLLRWTRRGIQALREVEDIKMHVGFGIVQAGVTVAVVTGVYEAFTRIFGMPVIEAAIIALFVEATVWVGVGLIYRHANKEGTTGVGPAGPFFWIAVTGGGALAVLGSTSMASALGRVIIVALGAYMWWLRIREVVPATGDRSQWRWTPRRLGVALGAISRNDTDLDDDGDEWKVRRVANAFRLINSDNPRDAKKGARRLARLSESTEAELLTKGARRFADGHVMAKNAKVDSQLMSAVIDEAERAAKFAAMSPDTPAANWPAAGGQTAGQDEAKSPDNDRSVAGQNRGQRGRQAAASVAGKRRSSKRDRYLEKAANVVATQPDISGEELLKAIRYPSKSERTGRRVKQEAEVFLAAAGRAVTDPARSNGHADIDPGAVADMATAGDRT